MNESVHKCFYFVVLREILPRSRTLTPDVLSLSHNLAHLLAFVIKFLPLQAHQFAELRHFQVFILLGNARSNVVAKKNVRCEHKCVGGGQKVMLRQ